jgi:hypothetical protein
MGVFCTLALVAALGSVTGVWAGTLAQGAQPPDQEANGPTVPAGVVPRSIPIQGRLTDASGSPINGTKNMTFTLYTAASEVVCQDNDTVTVTNGLFSTNIDSVSNLCTATDINGQALYLGIWVQGEAAEMTPRQAINPVPYAFSLVPGAQIGGTGAGDGSLYLKDASGVTAIGLTASNALLDLGGTGQDGDIYVRNITDTVTFQVDGNTGDVSQALAADGLVKAAVYANCSTIGSNNLGPHFNQVGGTITVINGTSDGECTIDFGFDVSGRFVTATPGHVSGARSVTYVNGSTNNRLNFYRWNAAGVGSTGEILVMVY